jgi:uncharacterized protein (TIGR00730 family)
MNSFQRICVFCGSSSGNSNVYRAVAEKLGQLLAELGLELVYGGGRVGLMGIIADAVMARGGRVTGVIPQPMVGLELSHSGLTELRVVPSMHTRKALMAELADAFIALPGGLGTLDEFCEIATWGQLGIHHKPCGLLNVAGYYDPLLEMFDRAVAEGFLKPENRKLVLAAPSCQELLEKMQAFEPVRARRWIAPLET